MTAFHLDGCFWFKGPEGSPGKFWVPSYCRKEISEVMGVWVVSSGSRSTGFISEAPIVVKRRGKSKGTKTGAAARIGYSGGHIWWYKGLWERVVSFAQVCRSCSRGGCLFTSFPLRRCHTYAILGWWLWPTLGMYPNIYFVWRIGVSILYMFLKSLPPLCDIDSKVASILKFFSSKTLFEYQFVW